MTNVHDNNFVLDFAPKTSILGHHHKNIVLYTAGWGFKFVPWLGKVLAEMATDPNLPLELQLELAPFSIERDGVLSYQDNKKSLTGSSGEAMFAARGEGAANNRTDARCTWRQ